MTLDLAPRFYEKIAKADDGCWEWTAYRNAAGYGVYGLTRRKTALAHRLLFEVVVGPVPVGTELDHLCRNRACVNPDHLEPVTHAENMKRSAAAQATHCVHGHEFTPENTYARPVGGRDCRACGRERTRRYKERKAA